MSQPSTSSDPHAIDQDGLGRTVHWIRGGDAADLRADAEILVRLDHPGVGLVLDLDEVDGVQRLGLRAGRGRLLSAVIAASVDGGPDDLLRSPARVVEIILRVAEIIAAAHAVGLAHLGLGPERIRIEDHGHIAVEGWEAGLERRRSPLSQRLTRAPATGAGRPDGMHQDIRDLGACLLAALLRRPAADLRTLDTLDADLAVRLPRGLADICRTALTSDSTTGYIVAQAFIDDLRAYLDGQTAPVPVAASFGWRAPVAIILAAVAVVIVLLRVPQGTMGEDDWGEPILRETFADSSWKQRWKSPHADGLRFVVSDGRLVSTAERGANLVYTRRLRTPLRLEYTAEITPGSLPCDVSFVWCEQVGLDEEPERYEYRGGGRSINLQFAGHDNTCNLITDAGHRLPVAYTDEALPVGRPLRLRVDLEVNRVRMFVDGREILTYDSIRPLLNGYLVLYAHYPGKAFDDITIWQKPHQELSALTLADQLFAPGSYDRAQVAYRALAETHGGTPLGDLARFRQGLCAWKQGEKAVAREVWSVVEDPTLRQRIAIYDLPDDPVSWRESRFFNDFARSYREKPALREDLRETWTAVLEELLASDRTNHTAIDQFLALRDELFPDDGISRNQAASALLQQGRLEEMIQRYPQARSHLATAMAALGRSDELLASDWVNRDARVKALQMVGDYEGIGATPAVIPVFKVLADCKLGRADRHADDPEHRYPALLHLGRPEHLLASRPLGAREANEALICAGRIREAAYEGLPDVPGSGGNRTALLMLGDLDAAEAQAKRELPGIRLMQAAERKDAQAIAIAEAQVALPRDLRGHEGWFAPVIARALIERWGGDAGALERVIRPQLGTLSQAFGKRGWFLGRIVLGEIPVSDLDQLTAASERQAWTHLATGIRAELAGDREAALGAYAAFTALPLHQRLLALNVPDAEVEWFVAWRLRALEGSSGSRP